MTFFRTKAEYDDLHLAMNNNEIYRTWLRWTDDGTELSIVMKVERCFILFKVLRGTGTT